VTRRQLVLTAAVFAGFAAFAAWRSPVPGLNEPHYLSKAKHFSDPAWCAKDFFVASADAHWVFYALFGPATRFLSLDQTAWAGRVLVWGGLALGWVRLVGRILPGSFSPIWAASLFLALQATGNLSGEWLVGGVEAKGFAYAALLWALAAACNRSSIEAGIAAGVAISFHPVVGVWGVIALVLARFTQDESPSPESWRSRLLAVALCAACSLPGLVPALALLADRPAVELARAADEVQVFERLKHHLDPARFSTAGYVSYAAMLAVWLVSRRLTEPSAAERFFARFVLGTLLIALGGLVCGLGLRSAGLMKFYPFRLFDVFLPIAVSIAAAGLLAHLAALWSAPSAIGTPITAKAAGHAVAGAALMWAFAAPGRDQNAGRWPAEYWTEFVTACEWIERNTPSDALFLTPRYNVGFKWYAQRAEYFTWKDCPQDAAGILEWKSRLGRMTRWQNREDRFSESALAGLQHETGVDFLLAVESNPYPTRPVYRNRFFSVYAIHPARE